ncbi:MAG: hypothetical protein FWB79_05140 [Treponema sp.]|nr:hypothetical protein [Treponema sp.]
MEYRKKVVVLSCVIASLTLVYVGAIAFDPVRRGARSDVYAWLDARDTYRIGGIAITLPHLDPFEAAPETVVLSRSGESWYVMRDGRRYPARRTRVNDFIAELTRRAPYPVRATSAAAHARLSLTPGEAARVTVAGGIGLPLLDLLLGQSDLTGRNVYMRRADRNEVRAGEDRFSAYVWAGRGSWYNLMLFPDSEDGSPSVTDVVRLTVYPPADETGEAPPMVFTRVARTWDVTFDLAAVNSMRVDTFVRDILLSAGDDFADPAIGVAFGDSRLVLEFGDGSVTTISFTEPDENNRRLASVSGTNWVYSVTGWMHQRLFPPAENFGL